MVRGGGKGGEELVSLLIIGPPDPTGTAAPTASTVEQNLAISTRTLKVRGIKIPLKACV